MMRLSSYLRRSRHGIYYFRIVLPAPLALALGQREFVRSLGVRSPKIARFSGYQLLYRLKPLIERLSRIMTIDPGSINPEDIKKLIVHGLDFRPDGGLSIGKLETNSDPVIAEREMQLVRDTAKSWKAVHDFTAGLSDEEFVRQKGEAERLRDEMLGLIATRDLQTIPSAAVSIPLRPSTLRECFAAYLQTKKDIGESTKTAYQGSYSLFATLIGGDQRMVHEITVAEIQQFNDAMTVVPSHATKRGIPLKSAAEMLEDPPTAFDESGNPIEVETISASTANLHLTNLQSFFDYAISSGRRNGENPFPKLYRHSDGNQGAGAERFEEDELRQIFDPSQLMLAKRPSQFWGPLLALYTGARLNEIACLDLADFVVEKGIPCISIRFVPRAKPNTIEHRPKRSAKAIKNPISRRQVPLHPDLWEIGLQDYLDDMKSLGATRLFPTLPADAKGKRERRLSHDGNEYLKRVGVHVPRIKVMHSFRDTVSDLLGLSDMDEFSADQWTGHATQGVKAKHYRRKVAIDIQATRGFKALDFSFIDTEQIQYRRGWWNEWTMKQMKP